MTKEEYTIYAKDVLSDISNRIDELQQRSGGVDTKVKSEFKDKLISLIQQRDELRKQLEDFENIPESRWDETKNEFMKGIDFLKNGFQKIFSRLSQ